MNNYLLSQICSHYAYTYIYHGHIWHRNKLSRCQTELLVSCSNDEHQTSLKWDSSSHPVAPECRVPHTVGLKHFTVLQWKLCETFSLRLNVPAAWHARCNVWFEWFRRFCKRSLSISTQSVCPSGVYSTWDYIYYFRLFITKLFVILLYHVLSSVWRMWNYLRSVRDFKQIN